MGAPAGVSLPRLTRARRARYHSSAMKGRNRPRIVTWLAVLAATSCLAAPAAAQGRGRKPSLSLRVTPAVAFTPARVTATAELRNVAQDDESFFCPSVEWEWGDGTQSEESSDCGPFEAGVSQVRTRYTKQNTYHTPGAYRVTVRLKRGKTVLLAASMSITVREGAFQGLPDE